ncbi:MAG: hypothetical protein AB7E37_02585 [Candidatus Altimarinota bacterium]
MALSPDMLQEYFEQAQKCKISGKIQKIQKNSEDQCSIDLTLFIKGENNETHFMNAILSNKECSFDSYYKPFFEGDIKVGNQVEYILDTSNYHSFDYIPDTVSTQDFPYCTENKIEIPENNYYFEILSGIIIGIMIIGISIFQYFYKKKTKL